MKKLLILLVAAATLASSCSKEKIENDKGETGDTNGMSYVGDVKVTQDDGSVFTKPDIEVIISPSGNTARMQMLKVSFAPTMPIQLDMTVNGISHTRTQSGYTLSGNGLVPIAMGGEFPAFTITGLSGEGSDGGLVFRMKCGRFPLEYSGTRK